MCATNYPCLFSLKMFFNKIGIIKIIGIAILVVILLKTDIHAVYTHLKNIRLFPLIISILLIIPLIALKSYRWHRLLVRSDIPSPFLKSVIFYFSSNYIGLITPGRLGEISKALFLKQYGYSSLSYAMPGVIIDRVSDLYLLLLFSLTGICYFDIFKNNIISYSVITITVIAVCSLPFFIIFRLESAVNWISRQFSKRTAGKWEVALDLFAEGFSVLINTELFYTFFITLLSYLIYFYQNYLIADSLNLNISYFTMIQIISLATLIAFIPISIAGLGTREAILIFLFQQIGLSSDKTLSFAVLFNLVYIVFTGIICFIIWWIFCSDKKTEYLKRGAK